MSFGLVQYVPPRKYLSQISMFASLLLLADSKELFQLSVSGAVQMWASLVASLSQRDVEWVKNHWGGCGWGNLVFSKCVEILQVLFSISSATGVWSFQFSKCLNSHSLRELNFKSYTSQRNWKVVLARFCWSLSAIDQLLQSWPAFLNLPNFCTVGAVTWYSSSEEAKGLDIFNRLDEIWMTPESETACQYFTFVTC